MLIRGDFSQKMSLHIQKVIFASLNVFKLLSICTKFQVNKWQFSIQKYIWYLLRLKGIRDSLATADIIFRNSNKTSPLRNVHQYIFPTLCNILHRKNSKYTIWDIDFRRDFSLCMRV